MNIVVMNESTLHDKFIIYIDTDGIYSRMSYYSTNVGIENKYGRIGYFIFNYLHFCNFNQILFC